MTRPQMSATGCHLGRRTRGKVWGCCPPFWGHWWWDSELFSVEDLMYRIWTRSLAPPLSSPCHLQLNWLELWVCYRDAIPLKCKMPVHPPQFLALKKEGVLHIFFWPLDLPSIFSPLPYVPRNWNFMDWVSGLPCPLASNWVQSIRSTSKRTGQKISEMGDLFPGPFPVGSLKFAYIFQAMAQLLLDSSCRNMD